MVQLESFKKEHGMLKATHLLGKPESTIRGRIKSGNNWYVIKVGKKLRCALIDE